MEKPTEEAKHSPEESTCLEGGGNVARNIAGGGGGYVEICLETITRDRCPNEGRVIAKSASR